MQYEQHDFVNNVTVLHKTGEEAKAREMLMKEIAQMIVYHRGHAIQLLNANGIKTNKFASDKELTDKLAENLGTNKKLKGDIAALLVQLNSAPQRHQAQGVNPHQNPYGRYGNAEQYSRAEGQGAAAGAVGGGAVGSVTNLISNIFGFAKSKTDQKTQSEANKMQLAQSLLNAQPQKSNTGLYIGIAVAVIGLGTLLYFAFNKKSAPTQSLAPTI